MAGGIKGIRACAGQQRPANCEAGRKKVEHAALRSRDAIDGVSQLRSLTTPWRWSYNQFPN
ncbi:MAG: hypothetical protein AAFV78_07375 [Bacteroidota bacterium]